MACLCHSTYYPNPESYEGRSWKPAYLKPAIPLAKL